VRACITCGAPAVSGRSRCRKHGPSNAAHRDPEYGYAWQQRRQRRIDRGEGCAWAWKGGCHGPLHLDHIRPRSLGGPAIEENEQLLCERHNISKGGRNRLR
jgi:5-methylcytosine-specific restriction endonuclease McrA